MSITLKEIAKQAGVSVSSVSLVLNNKPCRISESTRNLIQQIADKNHYRPNVIARSLVTKKTHTLGLIIPDIENLFFSSLAKTLELAARTSGYTLIIVNSNDQYKEDISLIDLLVDRGIDGLFLVISNESYLHQEKITSKLNTLTIPFVMVDRIFENYECNRVYFDHIQGAYLATHYLLEQGHRKIACICNSFVTRNNLSRLNGFKKAMYEYQLKIPKEYIIPGHYRMEGGYSAAEQILLTDCTAIFVCNDMMALGVLKKLFELGKKVPKDYSIVSYDNLLSSYMFEVELSSIHQDIQELGIRSCALLKDCLQQETITQKSDTSHDFDELGTNPSQDICLIPTLIQKKSVLPIL